MLQHVVCPWLTEERVGFSLSASPLARLFSRCGIVIRVASPKLTKAEKLVTEQMLALLEWAADRPRAWHPIGTLPETQRAAELLASRGVIEIRPPQNQYRLKPKT
jgi:hypothetical protein